MAYHQILHGDSHHQSEGHVKGIINCLILVQPKHTKVDISSAKTACQDVEHQRDALILVLILLAFVLYLILQRFATYTIEGGVSRRPCSSFTLALP